MANREFLRKDKEFSWELTQIEAAGPAWQKAIAAGGAPAAAEGGTEVAGGAPPAFGPGTATVGAADAAAPETAAAGAEAGDVGATPEAPAA